MCAVLELVGSYERETSQVFQWRGAVWAPSIWWSGANGHARHTRQRGGGDRDGREMNVS